MYGAKSFLCKIFVVFLFSAKLSRLSFKLHISCLIAELCSKIEENRHFAFSASVTGLGEISPLKVPF
jgi:hypothetical protein